MKTICRKWLMFNHLAPSKAEQFRFCSTFVRTISSYLRFITSCNGHAHSTNGQTSGNVCRTTMFIFGVENELLSAADVQRERKFDCGIKKRMSVVRETPTNTMNYVRSYG